MKEIINNLIQEFRKVVIIDLMLDTDETSAACQTAMCFMDAAGLSEDASFETEAVWEEYRTNPEQIEREYAMILEASKDTCECQ